jgi:hypothetical protein
MKSIPASPCQREAAAAKEAWARATYEAMIVPSESFPEEETTSQRALGERYVLERSERQLVGLEPGQLIEHRPARRVVGR